MVLEAEKLLPKMSSFGFLYIPKTKLAFFVYKCYNTVRILNLVKKRRFFRVANIAYIRVSSEDQNTGRQYELFSERGIKIDKFYTEKVSGKSISGRPQLRAMLDYIREDDIIYIESISRLSRSVSDFLKLVELFSEKNVGLVSLKENIDTSTAQGKFITTVFAALYELERANIRERQREGIDLCLKEGRAYGRPRLKFSDSFKENYKLWKASKIRTKDFIFRENLRCPSTFYNRIKRYEEELKMLIK